MFFCAKKRHKRKSSGFVEVELWVKRRHPRWMRDFFRETFMGFMEEKFPAFCKRKDVELGLFILHWFLKREVFVGYQVAGFQ